MTVTTLTSIDDFRWSIESSALSVVQFGTSSSPSTQGSMSAYLKYSELYPQIAFFYVDAASHFEIVKDAEIPSLPKDGTPLFLLYEAGEGCVDAVVGADSPNLGRTLNLFNPSSPTSTDTPVNLWSTHFQSPMLTSPIASFERRFSQSFAIWE